MSYPTMMTGRLASGKPLVGLNPLLVGQDGASYIPNSTTLAPTASRKVALALDVGVVSLNSGISWITASVEGPKINLVTNTFLSTPYTTGYVWILPYISSNPVANISTPKAVQQVGNYAVATNSHSVYKGNNLTQLIGKVAVGNGAKGLESKVVEDVDMIGAYAYSAIPNVAYSYYAGEIKYVDSKVFPNIHKGTGYYYFPTALSNWAVNSLDTFGTHIFIGRYLNIPIHSTIALDNSNSPAIKTLSTIATADDGELLYQVFGEEIVGTGDTGSFSQLANGTKADWNGTTVRTVCATIGTGVYE